MLTHSCSCGESTSFTTVSALASEINEERRPFSDAQNVTRMSRPQNVYYHPNVSCIQRQNPSFVGSEIQVPADLELLPLHEKYLEDHFGWRSTTF